MVRPCTCLVREDFPKLPLIQENSVIDGFVKHDRISDLLMSFPSMESIPLPVIKRLPITSLCSQPECHPYLSFWGSLNLIDPRTIVRTLIEVNEHKAAKQMARKFGFRLHDFPDLLQHAYQASFSHWVFSEKMSYQEVAQLCAGDVEAVEAFVRWTKSLNSAAAQCAITLGVHDKAEQVRLRSAYHIPEMSREDAEKLWNLNSQFFPILEADLIHTPSLHSLIFAEDKLTLKSIGLKLCNIKLVSDWGHLQRIMPHLETAEMIGMDCEWRPSLTGDRIYPVALWQLALRDPNSRELHCYLIDVYSFRINDEHNLVCRKINELLTAEFPLKLGHSFIPNDLSMLRRTCNDKALFTNVQNYFDVSMLIRDALDPEFKGGLAKAASTVLKLEMNKSQQCANWEKRPLTLQQVAYAALDAATLILLAEAVEARLPTKRTTAPLQAMKTDAVKPQPKKSLDASMSKVSDSSASKSGALEAWQSTKAELEKKHSICFAKVAFLRQSSILARTLRSFGFSVIILNRNSWEEVAKTCVQEGAVLVFFTDQERQQCLNALSGSEISQLFASCSLSSTNNDMRIRELIWLWSLHPLSNPISCLEDGGYLKKLNDPDFKQCQQCNRIIWIQHLQWYSMRNEAELSVLRHNVDLLAYPAKGKTSQVAES
eukprot:Gregarina_sp_Poly_1__3429@NODE_1999_length_2892_cov_129_274336_g1290_i0_p1_GENE_NODE_1999_length_2892_cov_129_274336_g1290_i0NODE_1999_length_2892_cov_129_274336_g1290_i0_p1_ORF_typecomplete_len657_score86_73DNA_pol_A_exo1/PF01612_20/8_8e02DNA_pol_A_exo1/PF01612_20/2_3e30Mut7C/PF01927_16/0_03YoeB_toxin/PF06769_14/0_11Lectin_C/PF00059_21/5_4e03Lectin_C/PF00059_21/0_072_NODE_1999_length_2892_cov_129_274336_g1290_i04322402